MLDDMASKKNVFGKGRAVGRRTGALLNDPGKLVALVDKKPPAPRKSKQQIGQKSATLAKERQKMRSTSTIEVLERML